MDERPSTVILIDLIKEMTAAMRDQIAATEAHTKALEDQKIILQEVRDYLRDQSGVRKKRSEFTETVMRVLKVQPVQMTVYLIILILAARFGLLGEALSLLGGVK